jgi:UDP-glucose 4-epimerase
MVKQVVLGGSGFIGGHLTAALSSGGAPVLSVGRRFAKAPPFECVEQRSVDLYSCSFSELREVVAGAAVVYHLAWSTYPATAELNPKADLEANVGFTVRLLESLRGSGARLVFCSSGGTVYGASKADFISELHPLRPMTAYGAGKVAAEAYACLFERAYGIDVRIARLANPYGLGQDAGRLQGALTRFVMQALDGVGIEIWGNGEVVRDYIHIDDAVEALRCLGAAPRAQLGEEAIFNIGGGCGTSLNQLIDHIEAGLRRRVKVTYREARSIDAPRNVLAIERAARLLGWRPEIGVEAGIKQLLVAMASAALTRRPASTE